MSVTSRVVLQQCLSARLMVKPAGGDGTDAEYVDIGRGVVIFVCFLKEATKGLVSKLAKALLEVKLSYCEERRKRLSILDLPGSVLIVPQATLGGKVKGKVVQYHGNIDKDDGGILYDLFIDEMNKVFNERSTKQDDSCHVKHGTYGNLQVLSMETNGPYTHVIDL